ncbi:unnamed protein product [Cuscuta campestris]|uniref:Serpin domain-containing protein n=1 Tax=Cuscuta campestris TaxID=132261 RepID=A0A484ND25_9ASTE|nr:unnamed protein product [Cuscuta campestris]
MLSSRNPVIMDAGCVQESIKNHVDVSMKLANHVFSTVTQTKSNLVFSPLSINVVLALLAAGSKDRTLDELLAFLKSNSAGDLDAFYSQVLSPVFADGSPLGGPRLSAANGAWVEQTLPPLKASFKHVVENVYKAVSEPVDFMNKANEVVNHINLWVKNHTGGLIKQILNPDAGNDETRRFSMYIFLPDAEDGLPSLVHKVTSEPGLLERCLTSLPNHPVPVGEFRIPKFKSSFHLEFSNILKRLGVASPFDGGEGMTEMVDGGYGLHVTNVIHKSFIEINEQGTEAAAVTLARMACGAMRPRPRPVLVDFVADHPFLYFIREDLTGAIAVKMYSPESLRNHVDVSLKLANHVFSTVTKTESNLVFSPLSISVVLGLLAAGSGGPTLRQLLAFLKSDSAHDLNAFFSWVVSAVFADGSLAGGPRLSAAHGAWIQQTLPLKTSFKHVADTVYKAACQSVDFHRKANEVVKEVNLWVEKGTRGLIKEILPAGVVDSRTDFVLANALYFKGDWVEKFDTSKTKDGEFHLLNGSSVQVPFMCSKKKQCVKAFNGFKVLKLPYKQGEDERCFSMYIFLSDAKDGLPSLMQKVSSDSGLLERCLPSIPVKVGKFHIPKFKLSFGFEVSDVLMELGVVSPFAGGEGLTEIVDGRTKLYVSQIFHKSFIEVNEDGTEASAATAAIATRGVSREEPLDFVADHPFLFFIREDSTGVILFIGNVIDPLLVNHNSHKPKSVLVNSQNPKSFAARLFGCTII